MYKQTEKIKQIQCDSKLRDNTATVSVDKYTNWKIARNGINTKTFRKIREQAQLKNSDWAVVFDINQRTLQRYLSKDDYIFSRTQSEKILEIAEVFSAGETAFGEIESFEKWLHIPCTALKNEKPIDLIDNSFGKELLLAELNRIEHGIFV